MILKFLIITFTISIANTSTFDLENLLKELEKAVQQNPNIANNLAASDIDQIIGGANKSALSSDETKEPST